MLDRIPPAIAQMCGKIRIVPDVTLPEPALPCPALLSELVTKTQWPGRQTTGKPRLDQPPPCRIVRVAFRQGPKGVQVIGQDDPGLDLERPLLSRDPDGIPQGCDLLDKKP